MNQQKLDTREEDHLAGISKAEAAKKHRKKKKLTKGKVRKKCSKVSEKQLMNL